MLQYIGAEQAKVVLYMDNRPQCSGSAVDVGQLITDNGNHWRKILTILAKLSMPESYKDTQWRDYRDQFLLQSAEQIYFGHALQRNATIHIFSGKSCWQRFASTALAERAMQRTTCQSVEYFRDRQQKLFLYTPYFDYRQFPNALIERVREVMRDVT